MRMPNYTLEKAKADWQQEVEAEMVRLIEAGTPPFDAATKARQIVSDRRASRARGMLREFTKG